MSQIRKGLAGEEDLSFDVEGIGATFSRITSTGQIQSFHSINAETIPLLFTTRDLLLYDEVPIGAFNVDDAITSISNSLNGIYKFPNQGVLDDITSAGSGVIISSAERLKLTRIVDTGSGRIISVAEREKLEQLRNVSQDDLNAIDGIQNSSPVGSILMWPTNTAPLGFVFCRGQSLLRADYSELFGVIGSTYGNFDSNTFYVPDTRGRFVRGTDNGAGNDPNAVNRTNRGDGVIGDNVGTLQDESFKAHKHDIFVQDNSGSVTRPLDTDVNITGIYSDTNSQGYPMILETGGAETRPVNIGFNHIIRALPI